MNIWKIFHDIGRYRCKYFPSIFILYFKNGAAVRISILPFYFVDITFLFNLLMKVKFKFVQLYSILSKIFLFYQEGFIGDISYSYLTQETKKINSNTGK